jgi:hypothetical protein
MSCFSLAAVENLLIWLILLTAIVMIVRLVVPYLLSLTGVAMPPIIMSVINIVFWAVICIAVIMVIFWLISCLVGGPGLGSFFPKR